MKVYLDTCVWCRPFDKPSRRIKEEAKAFHKILDLADSGRVRIVTSYLTLLEASLIEPVQKRESVLALIHKSSEHKIKVKDTLEAVARKVINECGLDPMDAAHVAIAVEEGIDIFLTTDDGILNKSRCLSKYGIIVMNPCDFEV